ncbi:MAG: hypothetical protein ACE5IQ_02790 [Candidatus Methylomirabilales bacterium]
MDWASLLLAGIAGALGAGIALLVVRHPKERRLPYVLVLVFSFAIVNTLFRVYLLPYVHVWQYEAAIERQLQGVAAYREIQQSDPQTYAKIRTIVRDALRKGQPADVVAGRIRAVITALVAKYIPQASDASVVDFATVMVREIQELTRISPTLCYQFLFPQRYGAPDLTKHLAAKTLQDDLAALAGLIRTATNNPQRRPDASQSQTLLETAYAQVYTEYGDDVQLLNSPHDPSVDKEKVCTIIAALYTQVLNMPKKDSGMVLRYMFSRQ